MITVRVRTKHNEGASERPRRPLARLQGLWIPNREFTRASSLVGCMWSGGQAITKVLAPLIIVNYGWEWCYRGFGLQILVWGYVWHRYAHSSPAEDPKCSAAEKAYISAGRLRRGSSVIISSSFLFICRITV